MSTKSAVFGGTPINIIITGATGFIGSHAAEEAHRRGLRVTCLVRPNRRDPGWVRKLPVEIRAVDHTDPRALAPLLLEADYILHVAGVTKARTREEYRRGNVDSTTSLLEAALHAPRLKKFCFVSSLTVAGPSIDGTPVNDASPPAPITEYGRSKQEAEEVCRRYTGRLPIVVVRPPAVYGPRDRDILEMFRWIKRGLAPIVGSREKTLSLIHAADLGSALLTALESANTAGKTYHVSDGIIHHYTELLEISADLLQAHPLTLSIPDPFVYASAALAQGFSTLLGKPAVLNIEKVKDLLAPHWVCDGSRFVRETGFKPRIGIQEGLASTLEWYRTNGWL